MMKLKKRVYDLLDKCRYNEDSKAIPTHQSYGLFCGVFVLDKIQRKELMSLYIKAINSGIKDFSILERQKEFAPIIVDIDLEMPTEDYKINTRLYNNKLILNIIKKYINAIK